MTYLVIRLRLGGECGACGRTVPPGRAVITDQIESPVFVPVCEGCELGLDGVAAAAALRGAKPGEGSKTRSQARTEMLPSLPLEPRNEVPSSRLGGHIDGEDIVAGGERSCRRELKTARICSGTEGRSGGHSAPISSRFNFAAKAATILPVISFAKKAAGLLGHGVEHVAESGGA